MSKQRSKLKLNKHQSIRREVRRVRRAFQEQKTQLKDIMDTRLSPKAAKVWLQV